MRKKDLLKTSTILFFILLLISSCKKDTPETPAAIPVLTTIQPSSVTDTTAISGGVITSDGSETITSCGVCWSTKLNPTTLDTKTTESNAVGEFISKVSGLKPGNIYHLRAYATNAVGTAYGNDVSFTTNAVLPTVTTNAITDISITTATGGSTITSNGGASITASGICWSIKQMPTVADSLIKSEETVYSLTKLLLNTTYYVRAYATNSVGTAYGNEVSFKTLDGAVDIDGNIYHAVTIGTQTWLQENLRVTKYRNGDVIGTTTPATFDIRSEVAPKYQWAYDGEERYVTTYGRLYTWYAATDNRNICPFGWHLPSDEEWMTLENFLIVNGYNYDGSTIGNKIARSMASINGWATYSHLDFAISNNPTNNSSGFSGQPNGCRDWYFFGLDTSTNWWSSSESTTSDGYKRALHFQRHDLIRGSSTKNTGMYIRCVKD